MCVLGGMLGGVTLIFIPLLTLPADVLENSKTENDVLRLAALEAQVGDAAPGKPR